MKSIRQLILTAALCLTALSLSAVPALQRFQTLTQEDGTTLSVTLAGDEYLHYYLTEDHAILVKENTGRYCYAVIDENGLHSSGRLAHEKSQRNLLEHSLVKRQNDNTAQLKSHYQARRVAAQAPADDKPQRAVNKTGVVKVPVILVQYKDVAFAIDNPRQEISRQLNEKGYSDNGSVGSAKDYFEDQSLGQFSPEFDVYGPYNLSQDMAFYGGNNENGNDSNTKTMILEACNLADGDVNFKQYDGDGDGMVDFLYVMYAGFGEASHSSTPDAVWPHRSRISASGKEARHDGVMIYDYACSNERLGIDDVVRLNGVGTLCHEFSHMLGLPDTYDVFYGGTPDMGYWSLMCSGCYNADGYIPCGYTAYERELVGWYQIKAIEKDTALQLRPVSDGGQAYKVVNDYNSNEFIFFENIQQKGWNQAAGGHGMLAVHVDYDQTAWSSNRVNVNMEEHMVVIPADNDITSGMAGDPYPGTTGNTELSDYSTPSAIFHKGGMAHKPLTKIEERDSVVYLNVLEGSESATTALAADKIKAYSMTAHWQRKNGVNSYMVEFYLIEGADVTAEEADGSLLASHGHLIESIETSETRHVFTNLEADKLYAYRVRCLSRGIWSTFSNCIFAQTTNEAVNQKAPDNLALNLNEETPGSFTASWSPVAGATQYSLEVIRKKDLPTEIVEDGSTLLQEDFSTLKKDYGEVTKVIDLFTKMPGWRTQEIHAGEQCIQVGTQKERGYLLTPILPRTTGTLTMYFSVRKASASDKDSKLGIYLATDASDQYYVYGGVATINNTEWKDWYINLKPLDTNPYIAFVTSGDDNKSCQLDNIKILWGEFGGDGIVSKDYQYLPMAPIIQPTDSATVSDDYSYYATQDTFLVFKDLETAAYTVRVRSVKSDVYSPYGDPQIIGMGSLPFRAGDLYYGFYSYENGMVKVIPGRDGLNYKGDIVIPDSVEYRGHHYQVIAIEDEAFKGCDSLHSVTVNANVINAGRQVFKGCNNLCYVRWNSSATLRDSSFIGANPNLLLYLDSKAEVYDKRPYIIQDGHLDSLWLYSRYPFYAAESFQTDYVEYGREFSQETGVNGASSGWETLWLPFDVDSVVDGDLEQPLYTFASGQEGLHYWLGEWKNDAFVEAAGIQAGHPYIIAFPNNDIYQADQLSSGAIYFVSHNTTIVAGAGTVSPGTSFNFVPSARMTPAAKDVYSLNAYDRFQKDIAEGSIFQPDRLWTKAFYAYMSPTSAKAPARLPIGRLHEDSQPVTPLRSITVYQEEGQLHVHVATDVEDFSLETNIYGLDGRCVRQVSLREGDNVLSALPAGLYYMLNQIILVK